MGQLSTLLWKNFLWCYRHPIKTAFFYLLPLLCCSFMFLTLALQDTHIYDCDHESVALPPSHPAYVLASFACSREKKCANQQEEYKPYYKLFENFYERNDKNKSAMICPGISRDDFNKTIFKVLKSCKLEKKEDMSYDDYTSEDLIYTGQILYYPKTKETEKILKIMNNRMSLDFQMMNSMSEEQKAELEKAKDHILMKVLQEMMMAGLCFEKISDRTIGFNNSEEAMDHVKHANLSRTAPWAVLEFIETGTDFRYKIISHLGRRNQWSNVVLQSLVESSVIEYLTGTKPNIHLEVKMLPRRCHKNPFVLDGANQNIGMAATVGLIVLAQALASEICFERVSGLLDFLLIAGVPKWKVKVGWFIFCLVFCLSATTFIALFFTYVSTVMLDQTDFSLLLAVSLLYGLSLVFLCAAIANLMSTAQRASIAVLVLLFVCYLVPRWGILIQAIGYTGTKAIMVRVLSLIFGPIAVQIAYAYIFIGERDAKPIKWSSLFTSPEPDDEVCGVGEIMVLMAIQCVIYFLFSTDLVSCFSKISFRRNTQKKSEEEGTEKTRRESFFQPLLAGSDNEPGICIDNLVKVYGNNKMAVNDLNVVFYKNQITAFLGHNGAGKSTTMNILTGMFEPTSGTAMIDGEDITKNMNEIRKTLGFCPQHDIVYPDLTVAEHMIFYGDLRRLPRDQVQLYANQMFSDMKMNGKQEQDTLSRNLSGGQKRKLSITIAFLGDPSTIILDEPTSAIDPYSRRAIWDVILRYRSKSTLLISTHYMQEADLLGDKIAIIDEGTLKCYGSPMYLKSKFGSGSFLKVAHESPIDSEGLELKLKETIPVTLVTKSAQETSFSVPLSTVRSMEMVTALQYLEKHDGDWGIASFGMSESTMEQVFFNVTSEALAHGTEGVIPEKTEFQAHPLLNLNKTNKVGFDLLFMQFWATWVKRWDLIKRSKAAFVFQILLPLAFSGLMLFFSTVIAEKAKSTEQILMHPWTLEQKDTLVAYYGEDGPLLQSLLHYGLGTKCMNSSSFDDKCRSDSNISMPEASYANRSLECECSHCPPNAVPNAPRVFITSNDQLLNLLKRNITDYLLKTSETGFVGAIQTGGIMTKFNSQPLEDEVMAFFDSNDDGGMFGIDIGDDKVEKEEKINKDGKKVELPYEFYMMWDMIKEDMIKLTPPSTKVHVLWMYADVPYNEGAPFVRESIRLQIPFLNSYNNILLRSMVPKDTNPLAYGISLYTEERNFGGGDSASAQEKVFKPTTGLILGMFTAMALMMPVFSMLVVVVNENSSGNKQLQVTMGLSMVVYWLANFVWDLALFLVSLAIMLAFMMCFPETFNQDVFTYSIIGVVYGLGMILMGYWLSFVFETARNCITAVGNIVPWFSFAAAILLIFKREEWYDGVNFQLMFVPPYFATETIIVLDMNQKFPIPRDVYSWEMLGKRVACAVVWIVLMIILIVLCEMGFFSYIIDTIKSLRNNYSVQLDDAKDPDVAHEENVILQGTNNSQENNVLVGKNLVKYFPKGKKLAVARVTFGVRKGECFGLLGINGAGKSTLFKMLTGFHKPTDGDATIMNLSMLRNAQKVHRHMGYCPQDDVLFERMTPGEHLHLYGRIKGVPSPQRDQMVSMLIDEVGLAPHKTKNSNELSGGNKRKLNFAISVVDFPDIMFLDEMTTGLDPEARRATWNLLLMAVTKGSAAIITSHSMEECEALCHRLVIMVNGHFKCLGGVQYLKDRYGNNYTVKLRLGAGIEPQSLFARLQTVFTDIGLVEEHQRFLEVVIPATNLKLSMLFETIHNLKDEFLIGEFSVSQTTLEHVFVNMVKDQV